jgi:hypothetical protein
MTTTDFGWISLKVSCFMGVFGSGLSGSLFFNKVYLRANDGICIIFSYSAYLSLSRTILKLSSYFPTTKPTLNSSS